MAVSVNKVEQLPAVTSPAGAAVQYQENRLMPLYEFDCSECGAMFEKLLRRADAMSEVVCPACGSRKVSEKISAFASITKGGNSAASGGSSCAPGGG